MNNWGVEVLNSSSINRASEISDISFTWIIVNSRESITLPCATKNRVLINQWGCSGVKSGVDAACFWSFLFPCTTQCPCLSSMIILHNSLIGYNWWGGTADLEPFQCNHSKMNVHSSHGLHQGSLMVHKTLIFYWLCPWLSVFTTCLQQNQAFWLFFSSLKGSWIHLKRRGDLLYRLHWSQLDKHAVLRGHGDPPDLPLCRPQALHSLAHAPGVQGQTGSSAHNHNGRPHPIPIAFPFTESRERSCGAYYCGWGKFSRNGRGDGKGSPLTLICENNTVPAPTEKWFSRWQSRPACLWQKTVN